MYLKSLVLKGFKSFADRSVLKLEPGMTVVVGPNGSGKSNVSDAVLWVLGEQSAKHLRGQAMEDVIFAGSSARQAVGLAEVDLVLDNSDGTLPLEFNEVVITRRMYRSGESEYLINGSPSRLMDILDVLNDSGLGRDTHSIISQGSLVNMLQARPEDRRVLIEEAAGILKHKKRKERSGRKLKNMDAELDRVNDIALEIDRQLKPLERQANRAQQYEHLAGELKEVDLTLAVDDLRQLQNQWQAIELKEKEGDSLVELARYRLEEKSKELEKLQRMLEEKGLFVGDLAEQRRRCQMVLQRLDSSMLLIEEKGRNMVTRLSELRQTIHRSNARLAEAKERLEEYSTEHAETIGKREALQQQKDEIKEQAEDVRRQRLNQDQEVGRLNSKVRQVSADIDTAKLKGMKASESLSTADVEDDLLKRRSQQIEDSLSATQNTLGSRRGRIGEIEEQLEKLRRDSLLAKSDIDKRVRLLDDARKTLDRGREELNNHRADLKALEEIDRAFDAASPMLQWVIDHKDQVKGVVAPLSEVFQAPADMEGLVEQLLGADLFGLLMEDNTQAARLVERIINANVEGGEISLVSCNGAAPKAHAASKVGQRLLDSLEYDSAHARVAEMLLGDVYVVNSVRQALEASEAAEGALRFVTRDGVVVWPGGKITFGMAMADTEGVLARKRRMNALHDEEPELLEKVSAAEAAVEKAQNNLQVAQADDFEIAQNIAQLSGELDSLKEEAGRLEQSITGLMQEQKEIASRRGKVAAESAEARTQVADFKQLEEKLAAEKAQVEEELAATREKRNKLFAEEETFTKRNSQVSVDLATVREREVHLNKRIDQLNREIVDLEKSIAVSQQTEDNFEILRLRVEPLYESFTSLREVITEKAQILRDRAQLEQAGQGDLRDTIEAARKEVTDHQKKLDQAQEGLTDVRIEKSKLEVKVEQAIKVITEDNGVLLDIALEIPEPEDRQALEEKSERLKKRIKHLGNVNPVAMEEYRKLKDRRDFIAVQVEDLTGARKALERIVAAIDRKMRNRFLDTFEQVNANFETIFAQLFPGGEGHLELTDPENPEETGVEVHAQPRGKTVRKQSLLSGGEQSLVSLALMFAVYKVRSTPFYILDEVEAALDDTNLRRLLAYLDSIRGETQFIVISHQRRTMEMADLLYGVSMRSDGVSKLVSQRLDQAIRQASDTAVKDVDHFTGA